MEIKNNQNFLDVLHFIKDLYQNKDRIYLHEPIFRGKEKEYLLETIDSTFVSSVGVFVDRFEADMVAYTGAKYAIAVVNGTAALHMALMLAGVDRGDIVITQSVSFIATCNAINYIGAEPAFVDIDIDTLGLSPDALKGFLEDVEIIRGRAIHKPTGRKIAACVPMHTFGFPCRIDEVIEICSAYGIPVIEDAAESLGSTYKGQQTGTFGLLGTYSFNGNKTITCGGGGIIVTNDKSLAEKAKHLTTQAKVPHRWEYNHDYIGYNYRCPNLNAALACAQLEQLGFIIENKRATANEYQCFFRQIGVTFVTELSDSRSNYWLNVILLKDKAERDNFLSFTNDNGVMTRPVWNLLHRFPMFSHCLHGDLSTSEDIVSRLVNLPSSVRV